ncbi:GspH/FimT family pseudopilin [Porticoccus sp.]|uniref:GspH/FimT family pseudopilin n=1 Tax=Porticoccus sp. TaxID=2024853 RepID=UPI000C10C2BF|nr:MAG: pilus assembly protein [Porticoccus sp.]
MERFTKQSGFTLIELMISIVVLAVLLGLAAPSFVELVRNNRIQTSADQFFTSLILARSEALKRNQPVVMCKSTDGENCTTANDWARGWLTYADEDADGVLDSGEPIINAQQGLSGGYTLRTKGSTFTHKLTYRQDGSASGFDTFVLCDAKGDTTSAKEVVINIVGRPRMTKTTDDCSP